jgi:anti-sigma factor (TIGR02949 family)
MTHGTGEPGPDDIGCLEAINGLYAYLDGEMNDPESLRKFERHLEHCRSCFSRLELEAALAEHIRRSAKSHASGKLHQRLRDLIDGL